MAKTKEQKEQVLKHLIKKIKQSKSLVITDYAGLNVAETEELRKKCREEEVELIVVKKTLLKRALVDVGFNIEKLDLDGSIAVAFSDGDEVAPAKILHTFSQDHDSVRLQGGVIESEVVGLEKVQAFALLPSKPELYAKVVGSLKAPISGFINVISGNTRKLINVLNAIKTAKE